MTGRLCKRPGAHVETVCTRPDMARFHFLDETGLRLDYARTPAELWAAGM